jgi:DNA-binding transcriptional MerR regulator
MPDLQELVTRAEVMRQLRVSSNQMQYFERSGIVEPTKREWDGRQKPEVYYTRRQVIEIKAIAHVKPLVNGKELRIVVDHLRKAVDIDRLLSSYLVLMGDRLYAFKPESFGRNLMRLVSKQGGGVFKIIQPIGLLNGGDRND